MDNKEYNTFLYEVAKAVAQFNIDEKINDLSEAFDMWYAGLLAGKYTLDTKYQDIDKVVDGKFSNDQLMIITRAGSYIRYAAENSSLIALSPNYAEFMNEFYEVIDNKNREDNPSEDAMEEVEALINETEEILDNAEGDSEDNSEEECDE